MLATLRVVALRHVHFEDLGSLGQVLAQRGAHIRYIDVPQETIDRAAISQADLVVALGGPVGVYDEPRYPWITSELEAIEDRLAAGKPLLGICLGSQLIARALGARVYAGPVREIGWRPLSLTQAGGSSAIAPLGGELSMFHWHGDTFDLPSGATLLASTNLYQNQIFSWGGSTLAFQCHPELEPGRIEAWLVGHAAELAAVGIDVATLRRETSRNAPALEQAAKSVFGRWLSVLEQNGRDDA